MKNNYSLSYANDIAVNPVKFANLKELKGNTVFLDLVFKEFYKGRSALGALFEDFEGYVYKMQIADFENLLVRGLVFQRYWKKSNPDFRSGIKGEFAVKSRSGYYFIQMVTP